MQNAYKSRCKARPYWLSANFTKLGLYSSQPVSGLADTRGNPRQFYGAWHAIARGLNC